MESTFSNATCPFCNGFKIEPSNPSVPCNACQGFGKLYQCPNDGSILTGPTGTDSVHSCSICAEFYEIKQH